MTEETWDKITDFRDEIDAQGVRMKVIGKVQTCDINIGGFYLEANGNRFVYDTTKCYFEHFKEDGVDKSYIIMSLIIGEDFDEDEQYTLTAEDLLNFKDNGLTAELCIEEGDYEIEEMNFYFEHEGEQSEVPVKQW
tara:strand:- start:282 stop:689 length:408 start_codon:yes stop_codon:yes gene_type:complete